jgi:hypothetical protein
VKSINSYFADEGSYKMYLKDMDLGDYGDELDFEFGTVPEGLFYPMMVWRSLRRELQSDENAGFGRVCDGPYAR